MKPDIEQIKDLFSRGYSTRAIAERLGISKETVRRKLNADGVDTGWPESKASIVAGYTDLAKQMLDDGKGWSEISNTIGFSARQLQRYVYGK